VSALTTSLGLRLGVVAGEANLIVDTSSSLSAQAA
jgi:hypothetical protein